MTPGSSMREEKECVMQENRPLAIMSHFVDVVDVVDPRNAIALITA